MRPGLLPQTDGGYLGLDIEAFVSALVSGAPGVFAAMLLQDAGVETDLVVRPGQRVSVSGDASLPRPARWGGGGFTVQQRGSLSLSSVEMPAVSVSGFGSLSLAQMAVTSAQFSAFFFLFVPPAPAPGSVVRLSEVTAGEREALTASLSVGADGVGVYDPPDFLTSGLVRSTIIVAPAARLAGPRRCAGFSLGTRPRALLRQVYADSYTLSGCSTAEYCGVFRRVAAHCAGGRYCPGGASARPGWSDATLCDGAPAYQLAGGGAVLYRYMDSDGSTRWVVGASSALGDCSSNYYNSDYLSAVSGSNPQPPSWPPDVAGYGWSDPGGFSSGHGVVHIVAGDGGGGGGR
eukprot:COSAG02_NODE_2341_length_9104_cov_2.666185_4_plen_347_part_00